MKLFVVSMLCYAKFEIGGVNSTPVFPATVRLSRRGFLPFCDRPPCLLPSDQPPELNSASRTQARKSQERSRTKLTLHRSDHLHVALPRSSDLGQRTSFHLRACPSSSGLTDPACRLASSTTSSPTTRRLTSTRPPSSTLRRASPPLMANS